jgi:hypothetical protein
LFSKICYLGPTLFVQVQSKGNFHSNEKEMEIEFCIYGLHGFETSSTLLFFESRKIGCIIEQGVVML